jgi:5-methylcytosine-specific restriction endonuclease McrA
MDWRKSFNINGGNNPLQAEIDHVKAKTQKGTNSYTNAQVLSKEQNLKKSDK